MIASLRRVDAHICALRLYAHDTVTIGPSFAACGIRLRRLLYPAVGNGVHRALQIIISSHQQASSAWHQAGRHITIAPEVGLCFSAPLFVVSTSALFARRRANGGGL